MDFVFSPEQDALRDALCDLLSSHANARWAYDAESDGGEDVWKRLSELGVPGLLVPEEFEGGGGDVIDLLVVAEEVGRTCAPVAHVGHAAGVAALLTGASEQQQRTWLPDLATGVARVVLVPHGDGVGVGGPCRAVRTDAGWRVSGELPLVLDAVQGAAAILAAEGPDGLAWFRVADVPWRVQIPIDRNRAVGAATLDGAAADLLDAADMDEISSAAIPLMLSLEAAEASAVASWALDTTSRYAVQRTQFGHPIGAFQAVKHRLADMLVEVECSRSAAYGALWAIAAGRRTTRPVAMAQAVATENAVSVTSAALQLHGGIGVTWEHDLHLYLRRAKALQVVHGAPGWHLERLAGDLLDEPQDERAGS